MADVVVSDSTAPTKDCERPNNHATYVRNDGLNALDYEGADGDLDYPEGGATAWSVVLGAWCAMIPRFETLLLETS